MDRRAFVAGLATGGVALAGCADVLGSDDADVAFDVGMRASAFVPREYEITVGETVVWYNNNDRAHTVTAYGSDLPDDGAFFASGDYDSTDAARAAYNGGLGGAIYAGQRYEHTFETAGTFPYFCVPHESRGMTGTIVVQG